MSEYKGHPLCSICGGIQGPITIPYPRSIGICPGHEPAPKHDGNLDKDGWGDVKITEIWSCVQDKYVQGACIGALGRENESTRIELDPTQALSLLAWLKQQEAELQRLAKEQEG